MSIRKLNDVVFDEATSVDVYNELDAIDTYNDNGVDTKETQLEEGFLHIDPETNVMSIWVNDALLQKDASYRNNFRQFYDSFRDVVSKHAEINSVPDDEMRDILKDLPQDQPTPGTAPQGLESPVTSLANNLKISAKFGKQIADEFRNKKSGIIKVNVDNKIELNINVAQLYSNKTLHQAAVADATELLTKLMAQIDTVLIETYGAEAVQAYTFSDKIATLTDENRRDFLTQLRQLSLQKDVATDYFENKTSIKAIVDKFNGQKIFELNSTNRLTLKVDHVKMFNDPAYRSNVFRDLTGFNRVIMAGLNKYYAKENGADFVNGLSSEDIIIGLGIENGGFEFMSSVHNTIWMHMSTEFFTPAANAFDAGGEIAVGGATIGLGIALLPYVWPLLLAPLAMKE